MTNLYKILLLIIQQETKHDVESATHLKAPANFLQKCWSKSCSSDCLSSFSIFSICLNNKICEKIAIYKIVTKQNY